MRKGSVSTMRMRSSIGDSPNKLPDVSDSSKNFVLRWTANENPLEYNSLKDKNLRRHFRNDNIQNVLIKNGIIDYQGNVIQPKKQLRESRSLEKTPCKARLPVIESRLERTGSFFQNESCNNIKKKEGNSLETSYTGHQKARLSSDTLHVSREKNILDFIPGAKLERKPKVLDDIIYYKEAKRNSRLLQTMRRWESPQKINKPKLRPLTNAELQEIFQKFKARIVPVPQNNGPTILEEANREETEREGN